jgi:hypothetical protein
MPKKTYTLEIIPALRTKGPWRVGMSEDADPAFSFRRIVTEKKQGNRTDYITEDIVRDVFEVRRRVFGIKKPEDALELFREFGPMQVAKEFDLEGLPTRFSAVARRRDFYENALLHRSVDNLSRTYNGEDVAEGVENLYLWWPLPTEIVFREPPVARVVCKDIEDSLRASVFLDRMDGFIWRRCRREDCRNIFELKSKRNKIYCSTECAHLKSVREYNERKKSAQKPAKRVARKGKRNQ